LPSSSSPRSSKRSRPTSASGPHTPIAPLNPSPPDRPVLPRAARPESNLTVTWRELSIKSVPVLIGIRKGRVELMMSGLPKDPTTLASAVRA
jgi:hypothetical protein